MTHKNKRTSRKSTKKRTNKTNKKTSFLTIKNLLITIIILFVSIVSISVLLIEQDPTEQTQEKLTTKKIDNDKEYNEYIQEKMTKYIGDGKQKFEEHTEELQKDYVHIKEELEKKDQLLEDKLEKIKNEIMKSLANKDEESKKIAKELVKKIDKEIIPILEKKQKSYDPNKPKLAIIIDDISYGYQVKNIQNIGYPVNMSFLPPTARHENSAKLAQSISSYMVHLPLQASSFNHEETNTLHIGDSYEKIEKRIAYIRSIYPKAKYINNHTGSKFTADDKSMDDLMKALKKYDFKFIDSRTTAKTVAQKYAQKYGVDFYSRNIFLDNKQEFDYIQGQLKKAIRVAKKTGLAIAIGHPHKQTMKVLKDSKDLLQNIELIYVDQL